MRWLLLLMALFPAASWAQSGLVLFPASQYGRNYLTLPQSAAGLSTTQLQNVLGRNANFERLDSYRADDRFRKMAAPVGRLDLLIEGAGGTGVGNCTASIISARFILTNRHCFPERDRVVRGSLLMDFYSEDNDRDSRRFEIATAPTEINAELDYAIVEVRGNPSAAFGTVRLDPRDPQPGESLLIIHHPMGLPKHMTRGGCRAYQPNAVDGTDIRHRCDTLPGSSGSPILAEASGRMVGLHYGGTTNPSATSWNSGKRLAEIARRSRILAAVVAEQLQQEEGAARSASSNAAAERAEIERRAREQAEASARVEIDRLKAQLDAERARVAALPPQTAPAARPDPAADMVAAETALGLTADQVRAIQSWLEALGHDPRGVDGRLGVGTRAALRSYQRVKGLAETGYLDADLSTRLAQEGSEAVGKRDAARGAMAAAVRPSAPAMPASPAQPAVGNWPQQPARLAPGTVFRDCPECPEMVVVPAGTTWLASGRDVTIAAAFALGKFEVTFEEWDSCVAQGGCNHHPADQGWGRGRRPVINVNWRDAQEYIRWITMKTGNLYRLPSGIEWEYSAQAGLGREAVAASGRGEANFRGGARRLDLVQNWDALRTLPVGSFVANGFGLHDMLGNVWEWTGDCADIVSDLRSQQGGEKCRMRIINGGSWYHLQNGVRSSERVSNFVETRVETGGFRVARKL